MVAPCLPGRPGGALRRASAAPVKNALQPLFFKFLSSTGFKQQRAEVPRDPHNTALCAGYTVLSVTSDRTRSVVIRPFRGRFQFWGRDCRCCVSTLSGAFEGTGRVPNPTAFIASHRIALTSNLAGDRCPRCQGAGRNRAQVRTGDPTQTRTHHGRRPQCTGHWFHSDRVTVR